STPGEPPPPTPPRSTATELKHRHSDRGTPHHAQPPIRQAANLRRSVASERAPGQIAARLSARRIGGPHSVQRHSVECPNFLTIIHYILYTMHILLNFNQMSHIYKLNII